MTQLQELKKRAKEKGLKGYSSLNMYQLQLLLAGKSVPKKLRKNQISVETQTDFKSCDECSLKKLVTHLKFKASAEMRKIAYQDGLKIETETGEVVGCDVDYERF